MKTHRLLALASGLLLSTGILAVAGSAQAASTAEVSILHGVPGATVDVYANGNALLKNFKPGTLTDPQMLPAGTYDLKVVKAGDGADGDAVIQADNVKVPAGANITVVAHLSADGDPTLTPFVNDVSTIPAGQARIIVRHTAAAPAVDVRAGGEPVFTDLTNPKQESAEVDAGTLKADVVLAGTDTVVAWSGITRPGRGHDHHRLRVGFGRGQEPEAGGPEHQGHAWQPRRSSWRYGRPSGCFPAGAGRPRHRPARRGCVGSPDGSATRTDRSVNQGGRRRGGRLWPAVFVVSALLAVGAIWRLDPETAQRAVAESTVTVAAASPAATATTQERVAARRSAKPRDHPATTWPTHAATPEQG